MKKEEKKLRVGNIVTTIIAVVNSGNKASPFF
jgi:hypothetical protein